MRCQNCGRELKNGARFCIGCGAQHDENGQLIGGGNGNQGNNDYNKTMMVGSTGFQQYQGEQEQQQSFQQYNAYEQDTGASTGGVNIPVKKKISPIMVICPIVIVLAILFSLLTGKKSNKKNVETAKTETTVSEEQVKTESSIVESETSSNNVVATESTATKSETKKVYYPEDGYWDAEAEHFYIGDEMQTDMWIGEYYVGHDGKKSTSAWTSDNFYVDATGKKVRNEWIEFSFLDAETGQKKIGYYYVDEHGKKVTNQTVEGRKLDDTGTYIPKKDEKMNDERETSDEDKKDDVREKESSIVDKKESSKEKESSSTAEKEKATQATQSTQTTQVTQAPVVVSETAATVAASIANNITSVSGNGKGASYQLVEESFSDRKITSFKNVIINDTNFANLAASVNEWNTNRDRSGVSEREVLNSSGISVVCDAKVGRNDGKIFSICETKSKKDNGVAYETTTDGWTWDAKTGQMLSIESIFANSTNYSEFTNKVLSKLKSYKKSFDEDVYEEIINGEQSAVFDYCTWYMTDKDITLVFSKNNLGAEKAADLVIQFTYDGSSAGINKLLLTKYKI